MSKKTDSSNTKESTSDAERYDEKDNLLMKHLIMDARLSARQISLKMGMSTVTVLGRVKRLEKAKIIKGYAALIDHEKVGYDLTAIIEVIAKKDRIVDIEEEISKYENVCAVYDITGEADTMIIAKFKSRNDLSVFVKKLGTIPYITNTKTHVVLNTTKEDFRLV